MPIQPPPEAKRRDEYDFSVTELTPYTDDYRHNCFLAWYQAGAPRGKRMMAVLPRDEHGRLPSYSLILKWRREDVWDDRAKQLNDEVRQKMEESAVERKIEMYEHHAEIAQELINTGLEYLVEHGVDSSTTALKAILEGAKLEKASIGIPEFLRRLSDMSNDRLEKEAAALLGDLDEDDNDLDFLDEEEDK